MRKTQGRKTLIRLLLTFFVVIAGIMQFGVNVKAEEVMETADGKFQYVVDTENGGYMICKYMGEDNTVNIPSHIESIPVTAIDEFAFESNEFIRVVSIPNTVIKIGRYAFQNNPNLSSVSMQEGVEKIDERAFSYCPKLETLTLPISLTEIGKEAFRGCSSLKDLVLPEKLEIIGEGSFYSCRAFTNIVLPESVIELGKGAFCWCSNLKSINIPGKITEIKADTFQYSGLTSIVIPSNVTTIGEYAFSNSYNLTGVTISDSVKEIKEKAFWGCSKIKTIEIPKGITKLSGNAFAFSGLEKISVVAGNPVYDSRKDCNAVIETATNKLVLGTRCTYIIPDSVVSIGSCAFEDCSGISSVKIPASVKTIEKDAFKNCGALRSITIPKSVTNIEGDLGMVRMGTDGKVHYTPKEYGGDTEWKVNDELVVNCVENSYAHQYAVEKGYNINLIEDDEREILVTTVKLSTNADVDHLTEGDTFQVNASVLPENATNKGVTFYSNDTNIVTVDSKTGIAKAVGVGKTYISGCANDQGMYARLYVTVANSAPAPAVDVTYRTHVQKDGWQGFVTNGTMSGTSGQFKRLEGIEIKVEGNKNLGIQYSTHCQTYGWLPWSANGEMNGTQAEAKRLEAIKIQLTGKDKDKYDVYYRVHAQSYGWLGWAKNGACAGTAGQAKRLEGIQIVVVKRGDPAPGLSYAGVNVTSNANSGKPYVSSIAGNVVIPGDANGTNIMYKTHVQSFGWQNWVLNGTMSGTSGKAKRLEGINIKLSNAQYAGGIEYRTHIQKNGWEQRWKKDGAMSGTSGEAKRLEAIQIRLYGEMANHFDVYYRVHAQSFGWLGWAKNGEESGTAGLAKRLEGIQIVLVPKGGTAPAANYGNIQSTNAKAYIKK